MRKTIGIALGAGIAIAGAMLTRTRTAKRVVDPVPTRTTPSVESGPKVGTRKDDRFANAMLRLAERILGQVPETQEVAMNGRSEATLKAIAGDVTGWLEWLESRPTRKNGPTTGDVTAYVKHGASTGLKYATIARRVSSISTAYAMLDIASPTASPKVRAALADMRNGVSTGKSEAKPTAIQAMLSVCGDDLKGLRDAAVVALANAADLKSREIGRIRNSDLIRKEGRTLLALPPTAAKRQGRDTVEIDPAASAVIGRWRRAGGIRKGGLFRRVDVERGGDGEAASQKVNTDDLSIAGGTYVVTSVYDRAVAAGGIAESPDMAASGRVRNEPLGSVLAGL